MDRMTERCPERINVGAFMAGALSSEEHARFAEHLSGCSQCAAETVDLAPVFAMLDHVTQSLPLFADGDVPAGLRDRVLAAVDRAGTEAVIHSVRHLETRPAVTLPAAGDVVRRRRRPTPRIIAMAAAAAIALTGGGLLVAHARRSEHVPQFALATLRKGDPVTMTARVRAVGTGTVAELVVWNSKPDAVYGVWFESPDGKRIPIGSFRGSAHEVRFRGETAVLRNGIVAVGVWADGGDVTRGDL